VHARFLVLVERRLLLKRGVDMYVQGRTQEEGKGDPLSMVKVWQRTKS